MMLKGAVLVLGIWCAALLYLMVVEVGWICLTVNRFA
jgi:hypothetical protein